MNKIWFTILLTFFFIHEIRSERRYPGKNVCPMKPRVTCMYGRYVECCSSSDCPSDKVCCVTACVVKCLEPSDDTLPELDADADECQKLKERD
ncbi:hypothetical protein TNCT_219671 [Trichonephila clavata]|uniref:WAP domain-containing protein n=1 Tax=Trichonephila clavata TaxID=2740835 RepID=A0A8X6GNI1_TRICU|nr:hypothetical protein TNCT_219671 [Trichonephila clavata]